jgi:hypothetical protein
MLKWDAARDSIARGQRASVLDGGGKSTGQSGQALLAGTLSGCGGKLHRFPGVSLPLVAQPPANIWNAFGVRLSKTPRL